MHCNPAILEPGQHEGEQFHEIHVCSPLFHLLGICLFQESTPELVPVVRVHVDEFAVTAGESVIHTDLHPVSVLPELKLEHA